MPKPKPFHLRLFDTCRSKDDGVAPPLRLSPVNPQALDIRFPAPPRRPPHPSVDSDADSSPRQKIDIFPPVAAARARRRKEAELRRLRRREARKAAQRGPPRASTSSAESCWFSSDHFEEEGEDQEEEAETETLVSSTTESSDQLYASRRRLSPEEGLPAVLRRLVGCVGGRDELVMGAAEEEEEEEGRKVEESFAVVKQSSDPRGDFRRSMAEMVAEKELYGAGELKQLLRCFLSLNAPRHHPAILDAFADVWEALFPPTAAAACDRPTAGSDLLLKLSLKS